MYIYIYIYIYTHTHIHTHSIHTHTYRTASRRTGASGMLLRQGPIDCSNTSPMRVSITQTTGYTLCHMLCMDITIWCYIFWETNFRSFFPSFSLRGCRHISSSFCWKHNPQALRTTTSEVLFCSWGGKSLEHSFVVVFWVVKLAAGPRPSLHHFSTS